MEKKNPEKIREMKRQQSNRRRKTDLKYVISKNTSRAIRLSLGKSVKAGRHWEDLVGYTLSDLKKRLQKTLPKNYTWQDYVNGELHIDHIIPISAFHFSKPEHPDFKKCWSLSNLQLLPAKENLIKSDKLEKPFQPTLKISFK